MKDSTKSKLRETILFKPDLYVFVNIAIAVGINLIGFFGARALSLPLWLDTIGTMLVSIAYGPLAGVIAALLSSSFIIIIRKKENRFTFRDYASLLSDSAI